MQELADRADAAGPALLKDEECSGNDAAENQLARSGAEEGVNGAVGRRAVLATSSS